VAEHRQDLCIDLRVGYAGNLGANLMELAVAPLLGSLVPEHRPEVIQFGYRIGGIQLMLDEGPHDACRAFRAHGNPILPFILEGIHLLFDNVRGVAD